MNIAELTAEQIITLAERLTHADLEGRRVRICTGSDQHGPWVKWAIGGGMWTPAQYNPETWVENPEPEPDTDEGIACDECGGRNGSHFLSCSVWSFNQ